MGGPQGTIYPSIFYQDAPAAIDWLGKAFGFEVLLKVPGEKDGTIAHSELRFGEGIIMAGTADAERGMRSPRDTSGVNQGLYLYADDVDALFARAKAAGAKTIREPEDQDYGGRVFGVLDPEGHQWFFGSYRPGQDAQ
jgi:uncharacterized glyoxalase superfamily protein PhnB